MKLVTRTKIFGKVALSIVAATFLMASGGCGSDNASSVVPISATSRQVPATYTETDGTPFIPNPIAFSGQSIVCTINAADIPGTPSKIKLSYGVFQSTDVVPEPDSAKAGAPEAALPLRAGAPEATLRNGRYRFFLKTQGEGTTVHVSVDSTTGTLRLPPIITPALPPGSLHNVGPGTGIPIFITNEADQIVVSSPSNTSVTLTLDAASVSGSPEVVSVTYQGPISGPSQVTKSGGQYIINAVTGTVTVDTPTSISIAGSPSGRGPEVEAP